MNYIAYFYSKFIKSFLFQDIKIFKNLIFKHLILTPFVYDSEDQFTSFLINKIGWQNVFYQMPLQPYFPEQ